MNLISAIALLPAFLFLMAAEPKNEIDISECQHIVDQLHNSNDNGLDGFAEVTAKKCEREKADPGHYYMEVCSLNSPISGW